MSLSFPRRSWIALVAVLAHAPSLSAQCTDAYEPNDTCAQAPSVALESEINAMLRGIGDPLGANSDYYRTVVGAGLTLDMAVDSFIGPFFLMAIYGNASCAQPLASGPGPGSLQVTNDGATPREYWLEIRPNPSSPGFTCQDYMMFLHVYVDVCAALQPDVFEPNEDLPSAAPLPPGSYTDLTVIGPDWDHYLIPVAHGSLIELTLVQHLTESPGILPTALFIDAVTGESLQGVDPDGTTTFVNQTRSSAVCLRVVIAGTGGCNRYDATVAVHDTYCTGLAPDALEENDTCETSVTLPPGEYQDLNLFYTDRDFYDVALAPEEVLVAEITYDAEPASGVGLQAWRDCEVNLWYPVLSQPGRLTTVVPNAQATVETFTLSVRVDGQQYDPLAPCAEYGLALARYDQTIGTQYCSAVPNSSGDAAVIDAYGSTSTADKRLALLVSEMPVNAPGIIFYGPTQVQLPLGNGLRCVGGTLTRLRPVQSAGLWRYIFHVVDFAAHPMATHFVPGSTWHFQGWFRDGSSSNLSDAVTIQFQ